MGMRSQLQLLWLGLLEILDVSGLLFFLVLPGETSSSGMKTTHWYPGSPGPAHAHPHSPLPTAHAAPG